MKRKSLLFLMLMALFAPLAMNGQTYTAGAIGTGTSTSNYPLPGYYGYQFDVYLYDADDIDVAGTIRSIAWYVSSQASNTDYTCGFTVWMKDVNAGTTLSTSNTFADYISGATQVYTTSSYTSSNVTTGAWNTFNLSSSFSHTKGKALLVCVKGNSSYSSGGCSKAVQYTSVTGKHWYKHQDTGTDPGNSVTGSLDAQRANIKLNIGGQSITTCSGSFVDSGGASGQYGNNESYTYTFYPGTSGKMVQMVFSQFATEGASWDYLRIYDGTSTSATQIGSYGCTTSPGTVTASNNDGALTLSWTSDGSNTSTSCVSSYDGWAASISCVSLTNYNITAFVQPANAGTVTGTGTYGSGDACTLTATSNSGYGFDYWIKNGTETIYDNPYNFTVTEDADFQAHFSSCDITTFPWNEDFESMTANTIPGCWDNSASTTSTASGSSNYYVWGVYSYNNNNMLRMCNYWVQSGTALINTPSITLPAAPQELTFDYSHLASCGDFYVKISQDGGSTFTNLWSHGTTSSTSSYTDPGTFITIEPIDLSAYANSTVIIQFFANANYGSGAIFVDNINIASSCAKPTDLVVSDITTNSAKLAWTPGGSETSWQYLCIAHGDTPDWTSQNVITSTTHSNVPANILAGTGQQPQPETTYDFYVRAVCGGGDYSAPAMISFTTAASNCPKPTNLTVSNLAASHANVSWDSEAGNYTVKYSTATVSGTTLDPVFEDGFENGLGSWTIYATAYDNASYNWQQYDLYNAEVEPYNHSGSYVAMSRSWVSGSGDQSVDNWLVTPQMTLGDVVKFWVSCNDEYRDSYAVYVSTGSNVVTSSSSIGDFVLVKSYAEATGTWEEISIDISAHAGQQGYVAIRHTNYGGDKLNVDDFGVYNTINTYSYGGWTTVSPNPTTESCQLTGLSAETLYEVQVQANCGGTDGSSAWSTIHFTTPDNCGAPQELASSNITATSATLSWADDKDSYNLRYRKVYFYEDFEGSDAIPNGWTTINNSSTAGTLNWQVLHMTNHSGNNSVGSGSYIYQNTGITPDNWLISPQLDLQGTLRVWLSGYPRAGSYYNEHFEILLSTTGTSVSDFTTTLVAESTTTNSYVEYTADLSSYSGKGYIAIHHFNCSDQNYLCVDDFGIYGSENWVALNPNPTTETANLTGLTPMTDYEWQVQGINCDGNGGTTDWSASATFTTPEAYAVTLNSWPESIGATLTGDGLQSVGSHTISAEAPSGYQFVNWTGTDGNVVSSNANYTFNLTGDITLQANFTMTTITSLPWTEGFESYTYSSQGLLNGDWATPLRVGSCPNVENYAYGAPSGNYAMHMDQNNSNYSMAVFPQFDEPLNTLLVEFTCARGGSGTTGEGVLGYVTDPSDGSTFVALATMAQPNSVDSYSSYSYNLTTISNAPNNANYRLAIRYKNSGQVWYFDDFSVKVATHTLTASVNPAESGTIRDGNGTISGIVEYNDGTSVTLTADAATGYTFQNWTIDGSTDANNPTTITMDQDHTVVANFTLNQYTVRVSANPTEGGTVAGGNTYSHGVTATLTATANTGYTFVNWTKDGNEVSTDANYSFTVTEAGEYVANFEANLYTLTVAVDPTHAGSVTVNPAGTPVSSSATYTVGTGDLQKANAPFGKNYTFVEMLYTKAELTDRGASAGSISSIAFNRVSGEETGQVIEVYMKATTESSLSSYISIDNADLVRTSYTLTDQVAGWVTIPLSTPFNWDGESNVLVAVNKTNTNIQQTNWYNTTGINSILYNDSENEIDPINPNGTNVNVISWRPNIQFTITPASTTYQYAYDTQVELTATPTANSGYYFYNWTDGSNNTYTDNPLNITVTENMAYTAHFVDYKRFVTAGSWATAGNWVPNGAPTIKENVHIEAAATIPSGCVATANEINITTGSITIADGGQLQHNNSGVSLTAQKEITGYTEPYAETNWNYYLFSSPVDNIAVSDVTGLQTSGHYDLYKFISNNMEGGNLLEWVPVGDNGSLVRNEGYIYASRTDTRIEISGTVLPSNTTISNTLTYNDGYRFGGWNLIGNPFVCNAYATRSGSDINYYVLNHQSNYDEFVTASSSDPVAPLSALMVQATAANQSVTYSRTAPGKGAGILNIDVNRTMDRSTTLLDRARVRFGEGEGLQKFQFNPNHTKVYIPEGDKDFAVYYADGAGTIPVNFKAEDNGRYTLDFSTEEIGFNYLHLIDNRNGNDVDLLQTPYYAFDAKSTDFASRFTLVFATGNDNDGNFAFFNNGVWIINNDGKAELQVVDALGRILSSETISGSCSKAINAAPGVYMLRLINGNEVKVQKVVVR